MVFAGTLSVWKLRVCLSAAGFAVNAAGPEIGGPLV
jgi:hypothetical protein